MSIDLIFDVLPTLKFMILSNLYNSPRFVKEPYSYENNLLGDLRMSQLMKIIETSLQTCPQCQIRKKNHYCTELHCKQRELICPECEVGRIDQKHYLHDYSYILPFLSKDILNNYYSLKKKITSFHDDIAGEIRKIEEYLRELRKVQATVSKQICLIQEEQETGKIKDYLNNMANFIRNHQPGDKLKDQIDKVLFLSTQQCQAREQQMKAQIVGSLDKLKWPKDPQKVLKERLKGGQEEDRKEVFISRSKTLELNEIDSNFKAHSEYFTQNLKRHLVEVKLESDLLGKPKFYESFIYHFKDCQKLAIENGNVNHLKTPLTFRKLKTFEFNFNIETDPQNIKLEHISDQIRELTFQRFREEDLKLLKQITGTCTQLRKLHLQFSNKVDLYHCKQLIQILGQDKIKSLSSLTLKIRTQNEVKRLYGYLSKFYKDKGDVQSNLNNALLQLIDANRSLTKLVVQGVKPLEMPMVVARMKRLPFLMEYKVYFENVDMMTEVEDREARYLEGVCERRKRVLYALAKASKQKYFPKSIIDHVVTDYLI